MNPVKVLISKAETKEALKLLLKFENTSQEATLLLSRLASAEKNAALGLENVWSSSYTRTIANINFAAIELSNKVKNWDVASTKPSVQIQGHVPENKLSTVKKVFKSIKEDLDNLNYSKPKIIGYINALNSAFESKVFSSFSDPICRSDWDDMNSTEQKEACKNVLKSLSHNEEKVIDRMIQFQNKLNGTVSLDESIQAFFNRPSIKSWKELEEQLTSRFSDTSLFGEKVVHAFNGWKQKLNALDDELSFAIDFNFDYRSDFGAFLQANLSPKNFNY